MKQGISLTALATELERQQSTKADYVADTRTMNVLTNGSSTIGLIDVEGRFTINDIAHRQIAGRLKIPWTYYDRIRYEHPRLLDSNVNELFRREPEKRMVRTLDSYARAFLSDRYRRLDNLDLAQVVLPIIGEIPGAEVRSAELTDKRMYIKVILTETEGQIEVGDVVQSGFVISNSEVGAGALKVEPLILRLICDNGMIVPDRGMKKYHVGRQVDADQLDAARYFRDETIKADDKAFFMKVEDLVRGFANEELFNEIVRDLQTLRNIPIGPDPVASVERLAQLTDLSDTEHGNVLRHLIEGGDLSQWGAVNAITRSSQDVNDYDRATELERLGGEVAAFDVTKWNELIRS